MINKIRIWIAYRRYLKAQSEYFNNPSWRNYVAMRQTHTRWYFLKHPNAIKPAW